MLLSDRLFQEAKPSDDVAIRIKNDTTTDGDNTHNLGAPNNVGQTSTLVDLQLSNEGAVNEVDGTWGQYTIQEGESDLFLINRRSGKKYKFMLQEVN